MSDDAKLQKLSIDTIRALAMDSVQKANAGHPGTAMALAPLAYLLYRRVLRHNPANPDWPNRDRFVLSAGHACILQYAALHLSGYNLSLEELKRFRQWESRTPGHPEHFLTEGVETTTGPLGQGFANGVGFAIADRFLAERYNRPHHEIVDRRVYAICSDGDMMEGVTMEAASIAGHLGLGRLVYFYDDNHITIDGTTALSYTTEDKGKRFEAHGWHVQSVDDAEDLGALERAIRAAQAEEERPSLIIVRSHIAYGAPNAIDTSKSHGSPLGEDEIRAAKEALGLDPDKQFDVPDEVYEHMDARPAGIEAEQEWNDRFERWAEAFPKLREDWEADRTGKPRPGWIEALPTFPAGEDVATRDAGKKVMQAFKPFTPTMIGGAADLVESTKTEFEGAGVFSATHAGRNIAFGIREHAMGSIVNGIALTQGMLKPYGSTFLIFSDYMRPGRAALGARPPAVGLGLDARLGRGRRGRPHPSAGRAPHGAPGDPEPLVRPAGRRERDRRGVADRARARRRPGRPRAVAPEGADARPADRGRAPRRLRPLAVGRRAARPDPDRDRLRGGGRARGREEHGRERPRRLDAVLGALRRAAPGLPRRGAAARRAGAALGRGRDLAGLGALGRRRGRVGRDRPLRRVGSGRRGAGAARLHRRERGDACRGAARAGRMKIAVAFDHRGVKLRERVLEELDALRHEVLDLGTDTDAERIDYPDKARELGEAIQRGDAERGVLVCGSGVGASVAACKMTGIRAAICHDVYSAHQGVEHDDMNVLCLGSEVIGGELAVDLVRAFVGARFDGGERYVARLKKVEAMEKGMRDGQVTSA